MKALPYGISVKSRRRTLTPSESAIANTLRQLIAERNATLAAEARHATAPSSPSRTRTRSNLRDAANTIGTVLAKHGLLPGADAAPSPSARPTPLRTAAAGETR